MRIGTFIVLVWLLIGVIAAWQRGYLDNTSKSCSGAGDIALTVIAGPLNYIGVNPKVNCALPKPSN